MTTTSVVRPPQPRGNAEVAGPVTFPRVLRAEWIKFRTLRSSWAVLGAAVAGFVVLGLVIGYNTARHRAGLAPEDAAASGPLQGYYLAQLLMGVLGVLFVSGEYSTGMIKSTFEAVPRRLPVLGAKLVVFGSIALVTMVLSTFGAFFGSQIFLANAGHGSSLADPDVLRAVLGTGIYLALIAVLGEALAWIVRSTPGGISTLVGVLLVVPVLFQVLPGSWASHIGEYLPSEAGASFTMSIRLPDTLAPWTGLGVLVAWVLVFQLVAAVLLVRRDA